MKQHWTTPLVVAATFAADAVSKSWALSALREGTVLPFIPGVLQITLTKNTGVAFGIGRDNKEVMTTLAITLCLAIVFWIIKRERSKEKPPLIERIGFGLILGGALGNVWDRLLRGEVTDFLEFAFISFPIFNVADALIDIGVGLIIINSFRATKAVPSVSEPHE